MIFNSERWPDLFVEAFFPNPPNTRRQVVVQICSWLWSPVMAECELYTNVWENGWFHDKDFVKRRSQAKVWTPNRFLILWVHMSEKGRLKFRIFSINTVSSSSSRQVFTAKPTAHYTWPAPNWRQTKLETRGWRKCKIKQIKNQFFPRRW